MTITSKVSLQGFTSTQSLASKLGLILKEVHSFFLLKHQKMKF